MVQQVEASHRAGDFGRVDVAVDPEGGLVAVGARVEPRRDREPDVASLEALADALEPQQVGMRGGERMQRPRQVVVAEVGVELHVRG